MPKLASSIIFEQLNETDVYIDGLKLSRDQNFTAVSPLLSVTNNQTSKLYINNLNMIDAISGLLLTGTGNIELTGSELTCSTNSGIGIDIRADGAKVKGTEVSGCGEGVMIAASGVELGPIDDVIAGEMNHQDVAA